MSQQEIVYKIFEFVVLLFSLSLHEAAHAWTASRMGDQTARMLGRVTLNPLKHIDPIGTVLLPLTMLFVGAFGGFLVGWARPTPVNTRNFKSLVRGDVITTLAGPLSNVLASFGCFVALVVLAKASPVGAQIIHSMASGVMDTSLMEGAPAIFPMIVLFYIGLTLNLFLAVFNLLPLPPLDGSHLVRHLLPYNALRIYDQLGMISLFLMFIFGGRAVSFFVSPVLSVIYRVLVAL